MGANTGHGARAAAGRPLQPQAPPKKKIIMRRILFEGGIILLSRLRGLSALLPACRQATEMSTTPTGRRKPPPPRMLGAREGQASLLAGAPRHVCFACPQTLPQQGG